MKSTAPGRDPEAFGLTFRTYMTPWTQDCMSFVVLSVTAAGIGVERDPTKGGLGAEEQWFTPWPDVLSIQHGHLPEPILRLEFATADGQSAVRDIRIPAVERGPFRGCPGPQLVEAIVSAYQQAGRPPNVEEVRGALAAMGSD